MILSVDTGIVKFYQNPYLRHYEEVRFGPTRQSPTNIRRGLINQAPTIHYFTVVSTFPLDNTYIESIESFHAIFYANFDFTSVGMFES